MCGPSKDNTYEIAKEIKKEKKELEIVVFEQSKNGKANAVWEAIEKSKYDAIAILDADISVDPEELTNFGQKNSLVVKKIDGMVFNPLTNRWNVSQDCAVNYIIKFKKN